VPDPDGYAAYLLADAEDARTALQVAAVSKDGFTGLTDRAQACYGWLRSRETLRLAGVRLIPGTPYPEGHPVATTFDLNDTDEVPFSLTGLDAKLAPVPLPAGFSATWSLADPDASGAVLTPSADGATAVLGSGVPDTNLMVSVSVAITNPDGSTSTLTGAEAVIVQATAAATVGIVPGTPTPEGA
jgi:hypothetical protein